MHDDIGTRLFLRMVQHCHSQLSRERCHLRSVRWARRGVEYTAIGLQDCSAGTTCLLDIHAGLRATSFFPLILPYSPFNVQPTSESPCSLATSYCSIDYSRTNFTTDHVADTTRGIQMAASLRGNVTTLILVSGR